MQQDTPQFIHYKLFWALPLLFLLIGGGVIVLKHSGFLSRARVLSTVALHQQQNTSVTDRETSPEADEIHFTLTGQGSVTFDWRGNASEIQYGLLSKQYVASVKGETPSPLPTSSKFPFHEARLTGLKENTLYYYAIGNGEEHTFHTPPSHGIAPFSVTVEADVGQTQQSSNVGPVQNLIASLKSNFVFVVGDLAYNNQTGPAAVDQHFNDVMVWSQDQAYMPAWGNHDWTGSVKDNFYNYTGRFNFPNPQGSVGSRLQGNTEDWYWFDYGNTRFIGYPEPSGNSWEEWKGIMNDPHGPMAQGQSDPKISFIVTFGHRPAYSSGTHKGSGHLRRILDPLGDKYSKYVLNLNGHSHDYERSLPQDGVVHMTVGTGGKDLEQPKNNGDCLWKACPAPDWSAKRFMHQGALQLIFDKNEIRGTFSCGPPGGGKNDIQCKEGDIIDTFVIPAR